jgi:hypothetical protein
MQGFGFTSKKRSENSLRRRPGTERERSAVAKGNSKKTVGFMLDTCVWIDLASVHANEPLLAALEQMCQLKEIDLLVPQIVRDEFARNKPRVIKESGKSVAGNLRRARSALYSFGDPKTRDRAIEVIDDLEHKLASATDVTSGAIKRIEKLFKNAIWCHTNEEAVLAASKRALAKQAPFHGNKNSFADAVLIELYGQAAQKKGVRFIFVTHNTNDFSLPNGDKQKPHPDIAQYFSKIKSRYYIKLADALNSVRFDAFNSALYDTENWQEPRRASEISAAIDELWDRVWYDRHMVRYWKIKDGEVEIVDKYDPKRHNETVTRDVWTRARKAAKELEKKYGKKNLGPYDKFEWGMINGKFSALRWVMGDEWDFLDT